jgi:hypothetical protein
MENFRQFHPNPDFKLIDQVRENYDIFITLIARSNLYCQWIVARFS